MKLEVPKMEVCATCCLLPSTTSDYQMAVPNVRFFPSAKDAQQFETMRCFSMEELKGWMDGGLQ